MVIFGLIPKAGTNVSTKGIRLMILPVFVKLTGSGIPKIIPSFDGKRILSRDHTISRFYMSAFSVSKLIADAPRVSASLFSSIVEPADLDSVQKVASEMRESMLGL